MSTTGTATGLKLDLGCGHNRQDGFHGVDIAPGLYRDGFTQLDLDSTPWPFETGSVQEIFTSHYVEHTPDLIAFMNECWRLLEPDGTMTVVHPFNKSDRAFQDPTHVRYIPDATWWYFNKEWRDEQRLDHYPIAADFEVVNIAAAFNEPWGHRSMEAQQFAVAHYWNVISDLTVDLRAIK